MSTAAMLSTAAVASPSIANAETDPVFAAIDKHQAALRAWEESIRLLDNDGDPALEAAEREAFNGLVATRPETAAGGAALVCYVADEYARGNDLLLNYVGDHDVECRPHFAKFFLAHAAAALRANAA